MIPDIKLELAILSQPCEKEQE